MTLRAFPDIAWVLIEGRDIKNRLSSFEIDIDSMLEETHGGGDSDDEWGDVGVRIFRLAVDGLYDDASGATNEALALTSNVLAMIALEENTVGARAICSEVVRGRFAKTPARNAFHKVRGEWNNYGDSEGKFNGRIFAPLAARTNASGTIGPYDFGSDPTPNSGLFGFLGVTELTLDAATSVTIKIRDSDDDITYADHITFDNLTSLSDALRAQFKSVGGDTERYIEVTWAFNGTTGGSETVTFAVAGVYR